MKDVKSNYICVRVTRACGHLILHNLNLEIHSTIALGLTIHPLKNGQSIYNGKIFGQFGERSTKLNAYSKAIW